MLRPMRTRFPPRLAAILGIYPIAIALLILLTWFAAPRSGTLALAQILTPHLALLALPFAVATAFLRSRLLAVAVVVLALVAGARFGPDWVSMPVAASGGTSLTVVTWNLQAGSRSPESAVASLLAQDADVVALQELTTDVSAAIAADPRLQAAYPHRLLMPDRSVFGLGILSRYPLAEQRRSDDDPVVLQAGLTLPSGRHLIVFNSHPMPGDIDGPRDWLPVSFDARQRDRALEALHSMIDPLLDGPTPLLVVGDYNVSPIEPGYQELTAGLTDVHAEIGNGPGWSWRPSRLVGWGVGLLRIDYVLVSGQLRPAAIGEDCSQAGDHCIVRARLLLD